MIKKNNIVVSESQCPQSLRANRPAWLTWLGRNVLRILGWRVIGEVPNLKKIILIGAPHTSNWDFVIAMATLLGLNIKMNWMAKHTIFKFGFKTLLEWLGGIPTNRLQPDLIVRNVTKLMQKEGSMVLGLTPEGTRKKVKTWKTGFLRFAKNLECPILMVGLNFPEKLVVIGETFYPTGNNEKDLLAIQTYYQQFKGKKPDQF